jgi:hypothetical protein
MSHRNEDRLAACERQLRRLRFALGLASSALLALAATVFLGSCGARPMTGAAGVVRVSELVVVDEQGVVRARLAARLPDAVVRGKSVARGGDAAGLVIYDETGQERGGYVTFDEPSGNAVLTLDTREGQVAYLAADPRDGAALRLWTGGHSVEMRADSSGARFTGTRDGLIVTQSPPLSDAEVAAMCEGLKADVARLDPAPPLGEVLEACAQRMPESECRACLGVPPER